MTTYTFPSIIPNQSSIRLISNTKAFVDPLTGFTQTKSRDGTRWIISMSFNNLQGNNRGIMKGFLAKLNGQVHRASIYDHSYIAARGVLGASLTVNGAGQTGTTISLKDGTGSTGISDFFLAGDYVSIFNGTNKELKMVTVDASMASGVISVPIMPEIHTSPGDGNAVTIVNPAGTFILGSPEIDWTNTPSQLSGVASPISAFELIFIEDIA